MDSDVLIEVVGYAASALIVLSITQKSILRLRLLGFVGALVFLAYSIAIAAYPIAVVNVIAASIHGWYLRQLIRRKDEVFRILHVLPESEYLLDFLDFYRDEIQGHFQPQFVYRASDRHVTAFILRDMVPAGLFIGEARDDGTFEVHLDFVIPQYRDFKIGSYVYSADSGLLTGIAPTCVWAEASNRDHARYLRRMGFVESADTQGRYEIQLAGADGIAVRGARTKGRVRTMAAPIDEVLDDLCAEYARIEAILESLTDAQWDMPSAAPGWTVADTVFHLAVTEEGVASTLGTADDAWTNRDRPLDEVIDEVVRGRTDSSAEILDRWRAATAASIRALGGADPDTRVRWAAAPLKPRTLATTRLAEHWAHMLDITGPRGIGYSDTDRLRHIAWLGHSTLPYAMRLAGLEPADVSCTLTAPSGRVFTYGPNGAGSAISGAMGAFCRVGARRLDAASSGLETTGDAAIAALRVLRNYAA